MAGETQDKGFAGEGMYRENIMDHFKHPHHFGKLEHADVEHKELNPVCGDTLSFQLVLDEKDKVKEVAFVCRGCAISMASASMLSDELEGKSLKEITRMDKDTILGLLGIELGPVRLKCAMLSLDTVKNAIHIYQKYPTKGGK